MNWKSCLIGISLLFLAYLLRQVDKWAYGKPKAEENIYSFGKVVRGWIMIVFLIICGTAFIIKSLPW